MQYVKVCSSPDFVFTHFLNLLPIFFFIILQYVKA